MGNDFTCDVNVRRAINLAIDREEMIENVLNGYGTPAYSVCDKMPWYNPAAEISCDREEAARLLNEAGWTVGEDGIRENMNVIAGGGLVGIVTDVGTNYATVRSIIDDSSQVSAMAQQSGDTCIVSGDLRLFKEGRLRLSYMEKDDDVKDGDMIVTSNISGKFLPGILIGYATDITVDYHDNLTKSGYLIPAARFDRLQEVLVITDLKDAGPELDE